MSESHYNPSIKSFVLRQGRLTPGQKNAFEQSWADYGIEFKDAPLDLAGLFAQTQPTYLEIGFGNGDTLAQMATHYPHCNFLGIEVHRPGVGHLLVELKARNLTNVKIICHNAVEVIHHIPPQTLAGMHIFFPDPWSKKKHHKRRLIQPWFVQLSIPKLCAQGYLHIATDWQNYAEHILNVMQATPGLINHSQAEYKRPSYRPNTKFEQRGLNCGHTIWDLVFSHAQTISPPA